MAWTKEQERAIYERGSNMIISAGAGSGKTAVLSERILDFCLKGNDIRRVLVLTFTEAAALEMKERIRKKLKKNHLDEQAEFIDSAYITTFDSYSLSIVKRYFYKLGLGSQVSIMDPALIQMKRKDIIREVFTEYYLAKNPSFFEFLRKYSLQDDKSVVETVEEMAKKLELIVDFDGFVSTYEEKYFGHQHIDYLIDEYKKLANDAKLDFLFALEDLVEYAHLEDKAKVSEYLEEFIPALRNISDYTELKIKVEGYSVPTVRNVSDTYKAAKEIAKKKHEELKKFLSKYSTIDEMVEEIYSTKDDVLFLLEMVRETQNRLLEYKKSLNQFGFNDIAKYAISLVRDFEDVREELKSSYDEILVDEYQDTSDIQETFLNYIENNNRYMVGDIKQSIYRFRNANPYIFKDKYDHYSHLDGGKKIDLTFNFRSRKEVLENINYLFNTLMTMEYGDANYQLEHQMQYGQKDYLALEQDMDYNMDILSYEFDKESEFTQAETEAFIIGREIKKMMSLDVNTRVKVMRDGRFVPAEYNDFAILIANATEFLTFKSVFDYLNIPLSIEASLDLKESILPKMYANILNLIAKTRSNQKKESYYHSLASIARSFIYQYSDEDIYKLVYIKEEYPILKDIEALSKTDEISYVDLFFKMNDTMAIYSKLARIGNVDSSLVVLNKIYETFKMFDSIGYTFTEAVEYLTSLLDSGVKMEYKPSQSSKNSVRIMTIHKSKGLEFPFCYFPLLNHGFNKSDSKATIGFNPEYGIFIPYADDGKSSTILRSLNQESVTHQDISEKIRLLYVAYTRAREKMIMILPKKENKHLTPSRFSSFGDMMVYASPNAYIKEIKLEDYDITDYRKEFKVDFSFSGKKKVSYSLMEGISPLEKTRISKSMKHVESKELKKSVELGLAFHSALEVLDLKHPNVDALPIDSFMKDTIKKVMEHPVFQNIREAKTYHEHEFYFHKDGHDYHGIIDLLVEYPDHFEIVDYKLSHTDSLEYIRQLSIYRDYILSKTNKPVDLYLLSILNQEIKKIEL